MNEPRSVTSLPDPPETLDVPSPLKILSELAREV